jgi:hypothetical protein
MSKTRPSRQPTGPLSVGDVVSAALRIYRDRFSSYFKLALTTHLWLFIPIYGWAKFAMLSGVISRLAFGEVTEKPESVRDVVREVKPRMWSFLGAGIFTSLIYLGVYIVSVIFFIIFGVIIAASIAGLGGQQASPIMIVIIAILALIFVLFIITIYLWMFSRFFIIEVALAVENDLNATSAIDRSWQLTKGFFARIIPIISIAFLITIPLIIVFYIFSTGIEPLFVTFFGKETSLFVFVSTLFDITMNIVTGALSLPFWQIVQAITYYDIRTQKEGLGLELHSHQDL